MSSKIKINPITKEIEIEVSDEFLVRYFDSLGMSIKKSKKIELSSSGGKRKSVSRKKSVPGENFNTIVEVLKLNKQDGTTIAQIVEDTKLEKSQIRFELGKAQKKGVVKQIEKGVYVYVKEEDK